MANPLKMFARAGRSLLRTPDNPNATYYSAVDKAIEQITQGKGTGDQFLSMILKTKGVKPAEVRDRGLEAILRGKTKVTKEELRQIAAENPPPDVRSKTLRQDEELEGGRDQTVYGREDYMQYRTPFTTNYREILFKIPVEGERETAETLLAKGYTIRPSMYDADGNVKYFDISDGSGEGVSIRTFIQDPMKVLQSYAEGLNSIAKTTPRFTSQHFGDELGADLIAHARAADMRGPNGEKILVLDEVQSDLFKAAHVARQNEIDRLVASGMSKKEAQAAVPEDFGFGGSGKDPKKEYEEYVLGLRERYRSLVEAHGVSPEKARERSQNATIDSMASYLDERDDLTAMRSAAQNPLPMDTPFKNNWQELVMKRIIDDAARQGYDKIIIAPGREHANRYLERKFVDRFEYTKDASGQYHLRALDPGKNTLIDDDLDEAGMKKLLGEEMAARILAGEGAMSKEEAAARIEQARAKWVEHAKGNSQFYGPDEIESVSSMMQTDPGGWADLLRSHGIGDREFDAFYGRDSMNVISGNGFELGGEGKGVIYDTMLPNYLNKFGKDYGVQVGQFPMDHRKYDVITGNDGRSTVVNKDNYSAVAAFDTPEQAHAFADAQSKLNYHSFDITPEMRERVVQEGLPLYQAGPIGIGVAAQGMQEEAPVVEEPVEPVSEYKRGGKVSMDAMRLAVMKQQLGKRNG